jgi:hypothetical protein
MADYITTDNYVCWALLVFNLGSRFVVEKRNPSSNMPGTSSLGDFGRWFETKVAYSTLSEILKQAPVIAPEFDNEGVAGRKFASNPISKPAKVVNHVLRSRRIIRVL